MKRKIVIATAAAALLVGGGTATAFAVVGGDGDGDRGVHKSSVELKGDDRDDADDRDDDKNERDDRDDRADDRADGKDDADDRAAAPTGVKVTAAEAIATALKERSGTVVSVDLDEDDSKVAWDVEIIGADRNVHNVTVDPGNGKVLGSYAEKDDDDRDDVKRDLAALKGAQVNAQDAVRAAAAYGTVTSLDLDDDGSGAWDAETRASGKAADWTVSLTSAKVAPAAADTDDDSDSDDSDD
ncbi:PepSY domain-containing protein [Streptomyces uncialis]|uniref:PepSY domain-containing protein n=1 Tax=Streptomyces uncialis TaxID=1048205 RepID=A0A1Q4VFF2_9ACTN|nr:PepSY domain-containing protein [Streptomyces uncialis]OKH96539.1 hypothetical protein AB852_08285 [Streptomyces uncialis]